METPRSVIKLKDLGGSDELTPIRTVKDKIEAQIRVLQGGEEFLAISNITNTEDKIPIVTETKVSEPPSLKVNRNADLRTSNVCSRSSLGSKSGPTRGPCLFCLQNASKEPLPYSSPIPGAGCPTLEGNLQVFFIIHKILDFPSKSCETILGSDKYPELRYWVRVCDQCFPLVSKAWSLHLQLLSIQTQINDIKESLKEKIRTTQKLKLREGFRDTLLISFRKASLSNERGQEFFEQLLTSTFDLDINPETPNLDVMDDDYVPDHEAEVSGVDLELDIQKVSRAKRKSKKYPSTRTSRSRRKKKKSRSKYPWKCTICRLKFEEQKTLNEHMEAHTRNDLQNNQFSCKRCQFPCLDDLELEFHMTQRHPPSKTSIKLQCKLCPYMTYRHYMLQEHIKSKHPGVPDTESGFTNLNCPVCNKQAGTLSALERHKRILHPELYGEVLDPGTVLICEECGEKFDNTARLRQHKNMHEKKKNPDNFKNLCTICGKGYKWVSRLKEHMLIHTNNREWMCASCGIDFKFKHNLNKHLQTHHADELDPARINPQFVRKKQDSLTIVECKVCHEKLPAALRRRHMKSHLDPEKAFKCDFPGCDRSYFKLQGLKKHKEINHSDGSSKVNCPYCNKEFIHKDYLKWHYRYCHLKKKADEKLEDPTNDYKPNEAEDSNVTTFEFILPATSANTSVIVENL